MPVNSSLVLRVSAVACATVVALGACGDGDSSSSSASPSAAASTSAAATPSASGVTLTAPAPPDQASLERAAKAALAKVPGSTVISIETEDNESRWEVQTVTSDGTEHEVVVDAADGKVLSDTPKQEGAADKTKHRDRVKAAKLDYKAAADKVLQIAGGGHVTELNLDGHQGRTVWEADVQTTDGGKRSISIDAGSGDKVSDTTG
ncbi:PepSY domain-containing protein [Actinomadura hibisca]|uniref:PepSY domain-containing protein n=1 Tax=Actinomadura hibisca TaxID=68565 RepID=UPI00082B38AB|nr:PepSY domain-containing protein [Actinomadura hibisca]